MSEDEEAVIEEAEDNMEMPEFEREDQGGNEEDAEPRPGSSQSSDRNSEGFVDRPQLSPRSEKDDDNHDNEDCPNCMNMRDNAIKAFHHAANVAKLQARYDDVEKKFREALKNGSHATAQVEEIYQKYVAMETMKNSLQGDLNTSIAEVQRLEESNRQYLEAAKLADKHRKAADEWRMKHQQVQTVLLEHTTRYTALETKYKNTVYTLKDVNAKRGATQKKLETLQESVEKKKGDNRTMKKYWNTLVRIIADISRQSSDDLPESMNMRINKLPIDTLLQVSTHEIEGANEGGSDDDAADALDRLMDADREDEGEGGGGSGTPRMARGRGMPRGGGGGRGTRSGRGQGTAPKNVVDENIHKNLLDRKLHRDNADAAPAAPNNSAAKSVLGKKTETVRELQQRQMTGLKEKIAFLKASEGVNKRAPETEKSVADEMLMSDDGESERGEEEREREPPIEYDSEMPDFGGASMYDSVKSRRRSKTPTPTTPAKSTPGRGRKESERSRSSGSVSARKKIIDAEKGLATASASKSQSMEDATEPVGEVDPAVAAAEVSDAADAVEAVDAADAASAAGAADVPMEQSEMDNVNESMGGLDDNWMEGGMMDTWMGEEEEERGEEREKEGGEPLTVQVEGTVEEVEESAPAPVVTSPPAKSPSPSKILQHPKVAELSQQKGENERSSRKRQKLEHLGLDLSDSEDSDEEEKGEEKKREKTIPPPIHVSPFKTPARPAGRSKSPQKSPLAMEKPQKPASQSPTKPQLGLSARINKAAAAPVAALPATTAPAAAAPPPLVQPSSVMDDLLSGAHQEKPAVKGVVMPRRVGAMARAAAASPSKIAASAAAEIRTESPATTASVAAAPVEEPSTSSLSMDDILAGARQPSKLPVKRLSPTKPAASATTGIRPETTAPLAAAAAAAVAADEPSTSAMSMDDLLAGARQPAKSPAKRAPPKQKKEEEKRVEIFDEDDDEPLLKKQPARQARPRRQSTASKKNEKVVEEVVVEKRMSRRRSASVARMEMEEGEETTPIARRTRSRSVAREEEEPEELPPVSAKTPSSRGRARQREVRVENTFGLRETGLSEESSSDESDTRSVASAVAARRRTTPATPAKRQSAAAAATKTPTRSSSRRKGVSPPPAPVSTGRPTKRASNAGAAAAARVVAVAKPAAEPKKPSTSTRVEAVPRMMKQGEDKKGAGKEAANRLREEAAAAAAAEAAAWTKTKTGKGSKSAAATTPAAAAAIPEATQFARSKGRTTVAAPRGKAGKQTSQEEREEEKEESVKDGEQEREGEEGMEEASVRDEEMSETGSEMSKKRVARVQKPAVVPAAAAAAAAVATAATAVPVIPSDPPAAKKTVAAAPVVATPPRVDRKPSPAKKPTAAKPSKAPAQEAVVVDEKRPEPAAPVDVTEAAPAAPAALAVTPATPSAAVAVELEEMVDDDEDGMRIDEGEEEERGQEESREESQPVEEQDEETEREGEGEQPVFVEEEDEPVPGSCIVVEEEEEERGADAVMATAAATAAAEEEEEEAVVIVMPPMDGSEEGSEDGDLVIESGEETEERREEEKEKEPESLEKAESAATTSAAPAAAAEAPTGRVTRNSPRGVKAPRGRDDRPIRNSGPLRGSAVCAVRQRQERKAAGDFMSSSGASSDVDLESNDSADLNMWPLMDAAASSAARAAGAASVASVASVASSSTSQSESQPPAAAAAEKAGMTMEEKKRAMMQAISESTRGRGGGSAKAGRGGGTTARKPSTSTGMSRTSQMESQQARMLKNLKSGKTAMSGQTRARGGAAASAAKPAAAAAGAGSASGSSREITPPVEKPATSATAAAAKAAPTAAAKAAAVAAARTVAAAASRLNAAKKTEVRAPKRKAADMSGVEAVAVRPPPPGQGMLQMGQANVAAGQSAESRLVSAVLNVCRDKENMEKAMAHLELGGMRMETIVKCVCKAVGELQQTTTWPAVRTEMGKRREEIDRNKVIPKAEKNLFNLLMKIRDTDERRLEGLFDLFFDKYCTSVIKSGSMSRNAADVSRNIRCLFFSLVMTNRTEEEKEEEATRLFYQILKTQSSQAVSQSLVYLLCQGNTSSLASCILRTEVEDERVGRLISMHMNEKKDLDVLTQAIDYFADDECKENEGAAFKIPATREMVLEWWHSDVEFIERAREQPESVTTTPLGRLKFDAFNRELMNRMVMLISPQFKIEGLDRVQMVSELYTPAVEAIDKATARGDEEDVAVGMFADTSSSTRVAFMEVGEARVVVLRIFTAIAAITEMFSHRLSSPQQREDLRIHIEEMFEKIHSIIERPACSQMYAQSPSNSSEESNALSLGLLAIQEWNSKMTHLSRKKLTPDTSSAEQSPAVKKMRRE